MTEKPLTREQWEMWTILKSDNPAQTKRDWDNTKLPKQISKPYSVSKGIWSVSIEREIY